MSSKTSGFRTTWIGFALVAALAGYTFWEYRKAAQKDDVAPEERKLFTFRTDEVTGIKIATKESAIELAKENDQWKMKKPVQDDADGSAVDAFLFGVGSQKGKLFRSEAESKNPKWGDFGLEPPGVTIDVTFSGKTETLNVGSKNAFDGSFYLKKNGELLLGDVALSRAVNRDANSFRSRRMWRAGDAALESVEIDVNSPAKDKYSLKNDGGVWKIDPPPKFAVDQTKFEVFLRNLHGLSAVDLATDSPTYEDKRNDLLLKPSLRLSAHIKGANWVLTAGQDKAEDVFAFTSDRPTVYKLTRAGLDNVRVPRDFFRDGKAAFKFSLEQASQIEMRNGSFHHKFKKEGSAWHLEDAQAGEELNADKLVTFFQNVSNLEAQEFMPPAQAKGFKPEQHLVIKDDKGKVLLEVSWGDEYKAKQTYNKGMTFRSIKTNLEKEAMGVPTGKISGLVDPSLVTKKAAEKPAEGKKGGK